MALAVISIGENSTGFISMEYGILPIVTNALRRLMKPFDTKLIWNSLSELLAIRLPTRIILTSKSSLTAASNTARSARNLLFKYWLSTA